jgi:signal transduction histidine kinase
MDETAQEYTLRIEIGARQMDGLIQSLLAYCRIAGSTIDLEKLDPGEILRHITDAQGGDAEFSLSPAFPPVLAHRGFLTQALSHLVSNALKFVDPGVRPSVHIRHETRGTRLRIWVEDNGIGIAPENHDRLFKTFERLRPTAFEGKGMGLAVVRAALERMGGEVGLESVSGQGSKFWIELAKCVEAPSDPEPVRIRSA